jgi:hypothetical protein
MAYLTLIRRHDGTVDEVVRCSLIGRRKPLACDQRCVRSTQ